MYVCMYIFAPILCVFCAAERKGWNSSVITPSQRTCTKIPCTEASLFRSVTKVRSWLVCKVQISHSHLIPTFLNCMRYSEFQINFLLPIPAPPWLILAAVYGSHQCRPIRTRICSTNKKTNIEWRAFVHCILRTSPALS